MKACVDKEGCIGCGLCTATCPEVFSLTDEHIAVAKDEIIPPQCEETAKTARDDCPVSVINISE
ncbi:MAG: ferredoxin [Oscillospiraceae bacterium]